MIGTSTGTDTLNEIVLSSVNNCITEVVVYYTDTMGVVNIRFFSTSNQYFYATTNPILSTYTYQVFVADSLNRCMASLSAII